MQEAWDKMFYAHYDGSWCWKDLAYGSYCLYVRHSLSKNKDRYLSPQFFRQVGYFFDYIQEFYDTSPYFKMCTKKKIMRNMNREYVEFVNGSYIEGLPLGDGNKGSWKKI